MVVSYTNNYGYTDAYAKQQVGNFATNADGGGNGGGGAFFKMFEEREAEEIKNEKESSSAAGSANPLDDLYNMNQGYYASPNVLKDYIDNSLLINTEQVACSNITQHLALKNTVKESLQFLNLQAAKSMVASKKRPTKYQSSPKIESVLPTKQTTSQIATSGHANFFEAKVNNPQINFFMTK